MNLLRKLVNNKSNHILILFIVALLFFHRIISNIDETIYPAGDILYIFSIEKSLFANSIFAFNSLPLWNPYVFSGSPFLGNPTSAMFYPLTYLFLLFPVNLTFGYMFVLNYFLIGIFTYLYARVIKIDSFGSLISATTIMLSGPLITLIFAGHLLNLDTFIWFPLALLFLELLITKKNVLFTFLSGFTITLMIFAGATQVAVYEIIALVIYFVLRSVFETKKKSEILKLLLLLCVSIFIGVSTTAVQLLPNLEFSKLSARSNGLDYAFASDFSLHPYQLLSFIFPYFFGSPETYWGKGNFWSSNGYIGILPLVFAVLAIFFKRNRYVFIFFILALFSLLYALGKYNLVFPFFYSYVPGFNSFRASARFLYIYAFSLSILSGIGVNLLLKKFNIQLKRIFFKLSIIIPVITLLLTILIFFLNPTKINVSLYEKYVLRNSFAVGINHSIIYTQVRNDIIIFLILVLCLFIAVLLKEKNLIKISHLKAFIFILIILNLWWFGSGFTNTKKIKNIYKFTPLLNEIIKDKNTYRVFDMEGSYIPLLGNNKVQSLTGVHSLYIRDYRDFLWSIGKHANVPYDSYVAINEISYPIFLDLLNVKYIIANKKINGTGLTEISKSNSKIGYSSISKLYYLYKNTEMFPRAYVVPNAKVIPDKQKVLNLLKNKNYDLKKYVLLEKALNNIELNNSSEFKKVDVININFNTLTLNVNLSNSGFLVLSEIYYPGWKAYDNGKKTEILNANYLFRSIYLTKGQHFIKFVYDPDSYKIGKIISLTTLIACFIYILYKICYFKTLIKKIIRQKK